MASTDDRIRGAAAREMVAQDARWLMDSALSSQVARGDVGSLVGLSLVGHLSRVAYEGARVARHLDPKVGIAEFARLLPDEHTDAITRARHATKLLDDAKKTVADIGHELTCALDVHRREFTGNAPRLLRWAETDLGIFSLSDRLLLTTVSSPIRFGQSLASDSEMTASRIHEVSVKLGEAICVLASLDGAPPSEEATLDLSMIGSVSNSDHRAEAYLRGRFDPDLSEPAKLLLLLIEGDVNLARHVLPLTGVGHETAVFRARFVVAWHALSSLQQILDTYPRARGQGALRLRSELNSSQSVALRTHQGSRAVRNQCVHYLLRHDIAEIDVLAPMFGLVEGLWEGQTYSSVESLVDGVLERLGDTLHGWRA